MGLRITITDGSSGDTDRQDGDGDEGDKLVGNSDNSSDVTELEGQL